MSIPSLTIRAVILAAAMAGSFAQAAPRASGGVPDFNVEGSCRDAEKFGLQGQDKDIGYKGCIQDERNAKDELTQRWSKFGAQYKQICVEQARAPSPSYVEVLTCLEMYTDGITGGPQVTPGKDTISPNTVQPDISK
ncbi:MAG: hypothetical protein ABSA13_12330 [Beijerinckiaceae bacterium]|jgi:hypothetical protein